MDYLSKQRMQIFDGNPHVSPMLMMLLIVGIFFLATVPLVGLLIIVLGANFQRRRLKSNRAAGRAALQQQRERRERERQRALLSL